MTTDEDVRAKTYMWLLDLSAFKESALITVATIVGRGFGFVGTLLLARIFDPTNYGVIQYAISIAMLMAVGIQPVGQHVIARYIGMSQNRPDELKKFLSNIWFMLLIIFGVSIFIAIPLLLVTKKFNLGILVIFVSVCTFYIYLGVARGYLALGEYIAADAGSSIAKVIMILLFIWIPSIKSPMLAMLIYGSSFVIPLIFLQIIRPFKIVFDKIMISKKTIKDILRFSLPIWLSHASYMAYTTVALLFLEHYTNNAAVGIFSLATSLSIIFSFIPIGFSTFLMPKVAGTSDERHNVLLVSALVISISANLILLTAYYFLASWCIKTLFGVEYLLYPNVYFLMALVTILLGVQGIITSVFVGKGLAQQETKSRLVTFVVTVIACRYLIPGWGAAGAAWAMLIGVFFGLTVFGLIYLSDFLSLRATTN